MARGGARAAAGKAPDHRVPRRWATKSQRVWVDAFTQRLRELGWIEGRTVAIEYRWGEGRPERYAEIAAEFVRLKVDVIFAGGTEAAVAAEQATSVIPIVFPTAGDPVGSGLVSSLSRPGGNVTGLSNRASDLPAKRLELLREVLPGSVGWLLWPIPDYSGGVTEREQIDAAARALGLELVPLQVGRMEDIAPALVGLKDGVEALYTTGDPPEYAPAPNHHVCTRRASADDVLTGVRRRGAVNVVRTEFFGPEPAGRP